MNIDSFIVSSKILLKNGQFESALCLICCVMDTCAHNKYKYERSNSKRIKKFINDYMPNISRIGMPVQFGSGCKFQFGKNIIGLKTDNNGFAGIEDIIYYCIRCYLVHDARITPSLVFSDELVFAYRDGTVYLPKALILGLMESIKLYRNEKNVSKA